VGVILLSCGTIFLVFYVSSRPITGVAALLDWRLLSLAVLFFAAFIWWEKRQRTPFINLAIFTNKSFNRASICAGIRMFTLSSTASLLMPLYLADVHHLSAASTGMVIMLHALALLITMRNGGQLADRWNSRWPVVIGVSGQLGAMVGFALLPATAPLALVIVCLVLNGLGAGLALPAMHRASMSRISHEHMGGAAGLYSMIRFSGTVLGTALVGVLLQQGLAQFMSPVTAYQMVFWFLAAVALGGIVIGWGLRE
jgi:MFS family permease